jgi:hypothetical protein
MRGRDLTPGKNCVHVIWLTSNESDADVPDRFLQYWTRTKRTLSDLVPVVWRDSDARAIVAKWGNEDFFYRILKTPVERSDVLRMMILFYFGGVYVDVDMEVKQPLPLLVEKPINLLRSPLFSEEFQSCMLVAHEPRHWLWAECVRKIESNFHNLQTRKESAVVRALLANWLSGGVTRMVLTVFMTGPPNIDRSIAGRFDDCHGQIGVLPDECYRGPLAVHHEMGSWTIFPGLARVRDIATGVSVRGWTAVVIVAVHALSCLAQ